MKLKVYRNCNDGDATWGSFFVNGKWRTFTLEDEKRETKVHSETRIPEGTYKVTLRTEGGFHNRYLDKYGDFHLGMLWVRDVPGFEYILIHTGNTDEHTSGCLLLGSELTYMSGQRAISASVKAYKSVYPEIAEAILCEEEVTIEYIDCEFL